MESKLNRWLAPACALALAVALPAGAAAHDPKDHDEESATLRLEVHDEDGNDLHFEVGSSWLGALISAVDIECEVKSDRDTRRMMKSLREQGEGGVYEYVDDDGDEVIARRRKGQLRIESRDDDERAVVDIPWEVAECLLAGIDPPGDLGRRIAAGDVKMKIDVRDDESRVRITLE